MRFFSTTSAAVLSIFIVATAGLPEHANDKNIILVDPATIGDNTPTISSASRPHIAVFDDDTASAADFDRFALKGGALMCALEGTDQTAGRQLQDTRNPPSAASLWVGDLRQDLHEWYWRERSPGSYSCQFNGHWQFGDTLRSLGLDGRSTLEGGDNACYRIEHWDPDKQENGQRVPVINQWYRAQNADFRVRL